MEQKFLHYVSQPCHKSWGFRKLSCECSSIQIIRKRRKTAVHDDDETNCSHISSFFNRLFTWPQLVTLTIFFILCFIPHLTHALPFDESLNSTVNSYSLNYSHRNHRDLLIDPIHQAEYGDEELESNNRISKSVFDMVLRTPPPPTSSNTKCPPGSQSRFEGGPCIKKSTDPVAFVDQSFLLDTLRGLTKDGVLLGGGGSTRTRKSGRRKRPMSKLEIPLTSTSTSVTTTPTTEQPMSTVMTEVPTETYIELTSTSVPTAQTTEQPQSISTIMTEITTETPIELTSTSVPTAQTTEQPIITILREIAPETATELMSTSATTDQTTEQPSSTITIMTEIPTETTSELSEL